MREALSVLAGLIALGGYLPYAIDIVKGRAQPARSARFMFAVLLIVTILQQGAVHSGWLVLFTAGELVGSIAILALTIKHGEGGFSKIDKACYALIVVDVICWLITRNALLALHLSVLADIIAFAPTLIKTWKRPHSETPIFFMSGILAPTINIVGAGKHNYAVLLFPVYLALVNLLETTLILVKGRNNKVSKFVPTEPVI